MYSCPMYCARGRTDTASVPLDATWSAYQHGALPAPTVRRGGAGAVEVPATHMLVHMHMHMSHVHAHDMHMHTCTCAC